MHPPSPCTSLSSSVITLLFPRLNDSRELSVGIVTSTLLSLRRQSIVAAREAKVILTNGSSNEHSTRILDTKAEGNLFEKRLICFHPPPPPLHGTMCTDNPYWASNREEMISNEQICFGWVVHLPAIDRRHLSIPIYPLPPLNDSLNSLEFPSKKKREKRKERKERLRSLVSICLIPSNDIYRVIQKRKHWIFKRFGVNAITNESRQSATVYQHGREKLRKAGAKGMLRSQLESWWSEVICFVGRRGDAPLIHSTTGEIIEFNKYGSLCFSIL